MSNTVVFMTLNLDQLNIVGRPWWPVSRAAKKNEFFSLDIEAFLQRGSSARLTWRCQGFHGSTGIQVVYNRGSARASIFKSVPDIFFPGVMISRRCLYAGLYATVSANHSKNKFLCKRSEIRCTEKPSDNRGPCRFRQIICQRQRHNRRVIKYNYNITPWKYLPIISIPWSIPPCRFQIDNIKQAAYTTAWIKLHSFASPGTTFATFALQVPARPAWNREESDPN